MNPNESLTEPSPAIAPVDLPELTAGPAAGRPRLAAFSPGLISGLSVLASVFSVVIALAGYRLKSQAPAAPAASEAAKSTPAPAAKMAAVPPAALTTPPPLPAAADDAATAADGVPGAVPASPRNDVDAAIRRMNDEANDLMPNTLPLPIPAEQYQYLVNRFQQLATRYFPQLAVKDSPFNRVFVAKYAQYQASTPTYFEQPDWPVALATECAETLFKPRNAPVDRSVPAESARPENESPASIPQTTAPVDSEHQDLPQQ